MKTLALIATAVLAIFTAQEAPAEEPWAQPCYIVRAFSDAQIGPKVCLWSDQLRRRDTYLTCKKAGRPFQAAMNGLADHERALYWMISGSTMGLVQWQKVEPIDPLPGCLLKNS
jgi:hypothetical protein